ncbi:hypothetical protein LSAT2_009067 [Lamellibrachia satsuma]|nr:hypothetical protein LSAT2_009067 [Lamellibrachia satsuma]
MFISRLCHISGTWHLSDTFQKETSLLPFVKPRQHNMHTGIFLALGTLLACSVYIEASAVEMCGKKSFDKRTQICCEDLRYELKKGTEECCGYKQFDSALMKCCMKETGPWVIEKKDSCSDPTPKISS